MTVCYIRKPKYCPQCGAKLSSIQECVDTHGTMGKRIMFIADHGRFDYEFDCYCKECTWSGDIRPDVWEI